MHKLYVLDNYGINFHKIKKLILISGTSKILKKNQTNFIERSSLLYYKATEQYKILNNIEKYKKLKNYRGMRHTLKLPVRGQRTHTNANTIKRMVFK
jgi:ribosomal protein S13